MQPFLLQVAGLELEVVGWLMLALFLVTLGKVMIR
jgi:hypothetical protein